MWCCMREEKKKKMGNDFNYERILAAIDSVEKQRFSTEKAALRGFSGLQTRFAKTEKSLQRKVFLHRNEVPAQK